MRKFLTTAAYAAALTFGSVAVAGATPPDTGNPVLNGILATYYAAVETACTPQNGVPPSPAACEAAMEAFADLAVLDNLLALPEVQAAIAANQLTVASVTAAVGPDSPFGETFLTALTDLSTVIEEENDPIFLAEIADVRAETIGTNTGAGNAASP